MDADKRCEYRDDRGQCCLPDKHFVEHLPSQRDLTLQQSQWYVHEARLAYARGHFDGQAIGQKEAHLAVIPPEAIPMRLVCEGCGELHIDEGEFATKLHHTHACQKCGHVWRPAVVPTVGVRFLPGFKNPDPLPMGPTAYERAVMYNARSLGWCTCKTPRRLDPRATCCATCDRSIPPGPNEDARLGQQCPKCHEPLWTFDYGRGVVPVSRCLCGAP